jgi:hypothetical protein
MLAPFRAIPLPVMLTLANFVEAPMVFCMVTPVLPFKLKLNVPFSALFKVMAPTLVTLTLPVVLPLKLSTRPLIVKAVAVFITLMSPLPELVAFKLVIVFAPFSVWPPDVCVNKLFALIKPEPVSFKVPLVMLTLLLLPALKLPVMLTAPVLLMMTLPVPDSVMPVMLSGAPVLVNETAPPLLVALKFVMLLAPVKVSPPAEFVVKVTPLMKPPFSTIAPLDVKFTLLLPAVMPPVRVTVPVLLTVISPAPDCAMLVIVNGALFVTEIAPVPLFTAFKLATLFAFVKNVPVAELVERTLPLIVPVPAYLM